MIELHIHLEGSVRPRTILELAKEQKVHLPTYDADELADYLRLPNSCNDSSEYLKRFDLAFSVLQDKKAIRRVACELVKDLDAQGILYAEIRMTPQFHTMKGLSQTQVVEAALAGVKKGMEESEAITANLILCTVRGADEKDNFETIVETIQHLRKGVVAVDLLGDEEAYPMDMYLGQFKLLNQEGIPFCVHIGEETGPDSIRLAVNRGALRIGHGLRVIESPDLMELLKEKRVTIEVCPTSNLHTGILNDLKDHPVKTYYEQGVRVAICTDDMVVCDTTLAKEHELLHETFGWTTEDFKKIDHYAIDAAFLPSMEKERLRYLVDKIYDGE